MKQLIVMISMIMLGIAISGMISQFGDKAELMSDRVMNSLDTVTGSLGTDKVSNG